MSLEVPYPDLNFVPLDILSASEMNQIVANYMYIANQVFDKIYPIGSIYMSATMSTPQEVAAAFGGTWVAWGEGKVPVGVDTSDSDFEEAEMTGGEKEHTLSMDEMPDHSHNDRLLSSLSGGAIGYEGRSGSLANSNPTFGVNSRTSPMTVGHNNLQPYITCYMFKRTA